MKRGFASLSLFTAAQGCNNGYFQQHLKAACVCIYYFEKRLFPLPCHMYDQIGTNNNTVLCVATADTDVSLLYGILSGIGVAVLFIIGYIMVLSISHQGQ